jgi:hypothetical protein
MRLTVLGLLPDTIPTARRSQFTGYGADPLSSDADPLTDEYGLLLSRTTGLENGRVSRATACSKCPVGGYI